MKKIRKVRATFSTVTVFEVPEGPHSPVRSKYEVFLHRGSILSSN
jgi:hypothetical protein